MCLNCGFPELSHGQGTVFGHMPEYPEPVYGLPQQAAEPPAETPVVASDGPRQEVARAGQCCRCKRFTNVDDIAIPFTHGKYAGVCLQCVVYMTDSQKKFDQQLRADVLAVLDGAKDAAGNTYDLNKWFNGES